MTEIQRRLTELAARLPEAKDRAVCLAGAKAIEVLRDVHTLSAGWDAGEDLATRLEAGRAEHPPVPHGDY